MVYSIIQFLIRSILFYYLLGVISMASLVLCIVLVKYSAVQEVQMFLDSFLQSLQCISFLQTASYEVSLISVFRR